MKRIFVSFLERTHGGALLELAVAFPLLLLLVMGVADYARMYFTSVTVANAALAGAHYGIAYDDNTDSMSVGAQREAGTLTLDAINVGKFCRCPDVGMVDCSTTPDCGSYGVVQTYDSVTVRKDFALTMRFLGLPSSVSISRTAILRSQ